MRNVNCNYFYKQTVPMEREFNLKRPINAPYRNCLFIVKDKTRVIALQRIRLLTLLKKDRPIVKLDPIALLPQPLLFYFLREKASE